MSTNHQRKNKNSKEKKIIPRDIPIIFVTDYE